MSVDLRGIFEVTADERTSKEMGELFRTVLAFSLLACTFAGVWQAVEFAQGLSSCADVKLVDAVEEFSGQRVSLEFGFCVEDEMSFCCSIHLHKTAPLRAIPDACYLKRELSPEQQASFEQCTLWKISAS